MEEVNQAFARVGTSLWRLHDLLNREGTRFEEIFFARAERLPDSVFIEFNGNKWTYSEAKIEVERWIGTLLKVLHEDSRVVGVYLANRPEIIWIWLACLASGKSFCAMNREHIGALLSDMLNLLNPACLITDLDGALRIDNCGYSGCEKFLLSDKHKDELWGWRRLDHSERRGPIASLPGFPSDSVSLVFTSGTTGRSKLVQIPHTQYVRAAAHLCDALGFAEEDVFHGWMPLSHVGGQLHTIGCAMMAGARVLLLDRFSVSGFWKEVSQHQVTIFFGFSSVLKLLLASLPSGQEKKTTLRMGVIAGAAPDLKNRFERMCAVILHDTYGMTEAEPVTLPPKSRVAPTGSCGLPGPDFQVSVLDECDRSLPPGEVGELAIRPKRPWVTFTRYKSDDEATLSKWRNLWLHTGDYGYLDEEGFVFFVARKNELIRRRGENVSIVEVEREILAHPNVADCSVFGVPSELGEQDIMAVIVLKEKTAPGERSEWKEFFKSRMARFMTPRFIRFAEAIPYTNVGKKKLPAELTAMDPSIWDLEKRE